MGLHVHGEHVVGFVVLLLAIVLGYSESSERERYSVVEGKQTKSGNNSSQYYIRFHTLHLTRFHFPSPPSKLTCAVQRRPPRP